MKLNLNVSALVLIFIALLIPNRISSITPSAFAYFPLEALLLGLALLCPGRAGLVVRAIASFLLAARIIFKMADMGTYQAFGRPFNPVLDSHFLADGMNLLQGTIGRISAFIVTVLLIALVIGIVLLTYVILGQVPALLRLTPKACSTALLAGLIIWKVLSFAAGKEHPCHFIT